MKSQLINKITNQKYHLKLKSMKKSIQKIEKQIKLTPKIIVKKKFFCKSLKVFLLKKPGVKRPIMCKS